MSRILIVDDEPAIRATMRLVFQKEGFDVTVASTVKEALDEIAKQEFDVLLSDLNIGQPGDGFTVVSAMRRSQPKALTLIITGYPDFETALRAIRSQVDDYVTKPADLSELMATIKEKLTHPTVRRLPNLASKRIHQIIRENKAEIVEMFENEKPLQRFPASGSTVRGFPGFRRSFTVDRPSVVLAGTRAAPQTAAHRVDLHGKDRLSQ